MLRGSSAPDRQWTGCAAPPRLPPLGGVLALDRRTAADDPGIVPGESRGGRVPRPVGVVAAEDPAQAPAVQPARDRCRDTGGGRLRQAGRKGVRLARILGAVKAAREVLASSGTGPGGFSRIDPLEDSPDAGAGKRGTRERNVRH